MKKSLLLLFALFLTVGVGSVTAQDQYSGEATVTGVVYDKNAEPIPRATIALYDSTGAELLGGTTSKTNGTFSLETEPGSYVVRISFVSYSTHKEKLTLAAGETIDIGEVLLEQNVTMLEQVEVRAERSTMEMNFDSRTFHVGQDIVSMGGSALTVLDNVPSIVTDFEGNVSLRGSQGVQILINGRPSSLVRNGTEALSSIPANLIQEIEIITNPSARYSAEGTAGIINIILKKNVRLGFNGSVSASTGFPHNHEIGTNLNYHVNNINWFFSTDLEYESRPRSGEAYQLFGSPDTVYIYNQVSDSRDYELEGGLRFGADFYLPDEQMLTVSTRIDAEGGEDEEEVIYTDYAIDEELWQRIVGQNIHRKIVPDNVYQRISREDMEEARERDFDISLQYENRFGGSPDHRLTADIDFDFGQEQEHSDLVQTLVEGAGEPLNQRTETAEIFRDLRMDVDYERPAGDNGRFEAGIRFNFDWMESDYLVEEEQNGTWVPLPAFNDNFIYYENVNALYAIYSGEAEPFTYQLGLRAEQTIINTELTETGDRNEQSYLNLFPSAFLSYKMNEKNSFQISYSRRLRRPWSRMLLPYTDYADSRNRRSGNPNLKPEFGNSFEAGYLRYWGTGSLLTSVYYRYRTDVFERITTVDDDGIRRTFPINLATEQAWGIEFTADQELFDGLQLLGSLNLYQSDSHGAYEEQIFNSSTGAFYSRIRARWRFLDGWNYEASLFYRGPRETTQGREDASSQISSGISRTLFDGKATISLSIDDLFNARQHDEIIDGINSYSISNYQWSSRSFRLNFTYRFSQHSLGENSYE